jgi:hypothetical protein
MLLAKESILSAKGQLSYEGGVTFRFDSDGSFTGWTDRRELGMKTGMGPLPIGQSLEAAAHLGFLAWPRT